MRREANGRAWEEVLQLDGLGFEVLVIVLVVEFVATEDAVLPSLPTGAVDLTKAE